MAALGYLHVFNVQPRNKTLRIKNGDAVYATETCALYTRGF